MQKRLRSLVFVFVLAFMAFVVYAEEITISTYYPSPYGSYKNLDTMDNTHLATEGGRVGIGMKTPQTLLDLADTTKETSMSYGGIGCGQIWDLGVKGQVTRVDWDPGGKPNEWTAIAVHSSEPIRKVGGTFGFSRKGAGGHYTETLLPEIKNISVQVTQMIPGDPTEKCHVDSITVYYIPFN